MIEHVGTRGASASFNKNLNENIDTEIERERERERNVDDTISTACGLDRADGNLKDIRSQGRSEGGGRERI